jgi:hypothetical protein
LKAILDPEHELLKLAQLIDWERFDDAFGRFYHERKGRRGLPTRLMTGLHLLKHMKGLSDEETCTAWRENPYFQAFCGETHFQHQLPLDRTSMTRWRKRIGVDEMELLLAESLVVAVKTKAVTSVLFELISARYERRSMLITANQPFGAWNTIFPDPAMTLAAVDRLVHHATIFEMNVESYRRQAAQMAKEPAQTTKTATTSDNNAD